MATDDSKVIRNDLILIGGALLVLLGACVFFAIFLR